MMAGPQITNRCQCRRNPVEQRCCARLPGQLCVLETWLVGLGGGEKHELLSPKVDSPPDLTNAADPGFGKPYVRRLFYSVAKYFWTMLKDKLFCPRFPSN